MTTVRADSCSLAKYQKSGMILILPKGRRVYRIISQELSNLHDSNYAVIYTKRMLKYYNLE